MKETLEARLLLARVILARLKAEDGAPEAIAFWEEGVAECEAEIEREQVTAMAEDVRFTKDDQGQAVLIRGEERTVLGPAESVGEEMCRFLAEIDFGECR